jgi:serine/threonine-protein kinase
MATRVFLSSTGTDLAEYRHAAIDVCNRLGLLPIGMEFFGSMGSGATEGSKDKITQADVYVGVFAYRYGYVEAGYEKAVTEIEFDFAGECGIERLCFLVDPSYPWPVDAIERQRQDAVDRLRDKVERTTIRETFTTVDDFRAKLTASLVDWNSRHGGGPPAQESESIYASADRRLDEAIQHFDLDAPTRYFIGRSSVFSRIDAFVARHMCGYVEVVGEAGLGKTALAAEIAKRRRAIVFLASVSAGTRRPEQFLEHVCSELIVRYGLERSTLPANLDSNVLLTRLLAEAAAQARPVWLVVDGLDEAEPPQHGANPLLLPNLLPDGVFAVVTRRDGELRRDASMPWLGISLTRDDREQTDDIEALLRDRAEHDQALARAIADARPTVSVAEFVASVREASEGNFMYLSYLLADLAEGGVSGPRLHQLPRGLGAYYEQFWDELSVTMSSDWELWANLYEPVLGFLAAAQEPVPADWLASVVERRAAEIEKRVLLPWNQLLGRDEAAGQVCWRLVHRSFGEYLDNPNRIDVPAAHRAIAQRYMSGSDGVEAWDAYGLRHGPIHLAEAARRSKGPQREELVEALARLVTDDRLLVRQLEVLRDPGPSQRHLTLAHQLLAGEASPNCDVPLVEVAIARLRLRRSLLQPKDVFDAARGGDLAAAERLVDLLAPGLNHEWRRTLLLIIAWAAAEVAPDNARALTDHARPIGPVGSSSTPVEMILARLDNKRPHRELPPAPKADEAAAMVDRLAGLAPTSIKYELVDETGADLSEWQGPYLVALCTASPSVGDPLLDKYLDVHTAYPYQPYRRRSLWHLLPAVLAHPDQQWVRQRLIDVAIAALATADVEFLHGIELAALAALARAGDGYAEADLSRQREAALAAAHGLPPKPGRGEGDVWGTHRRQLIAHAEAAARLYPSQRLGADIAAEAVAITGGFTGFTAPMCLTLAEGVSVAAGVGPPPEDLFERALDAAHNVLDPVFCAQTTARVNTMRERWWPGPASADLPGMAAHLADYPAAAEFSAVHTVDDQYSRRSREGSGDLPARAARTLREIAAAYQFPLSDLLALEQPAPWRTEGFPPPGIQHPADQPATWTADELLPLGTRVAIPDPGMPPLIAARIAGAALAAGMRSELDWASVATTIRRVTTVAAAEPSAALPTTLARLLLATPVTDQSIFARLKDQLPL